MPFKMPNPAIFLHKRHLLQPLAIRCRTVDSGTISEEASDFKFTTVSVRTSTEQPESMDRVNFIIGNITTEQELQTVDFTVYIY